MVRFESILDVIGNTPLVKLNNITKGLNAEIYAKIESFNPGFSIKDRAALNMIEEAEKSGKIIQGTRIIEPTSGNTGIGLALVCAVKGYPITVVMPDSTSEERRKILKAFGADVILTPGIDGMKGAISKAEETAKEYDNAFIPQQFENLANPMVHQKTTAIEIWEDMNHEVDVFVAGVGTGGTITGTGRTLKIFNPNIQIVAVEPKGSPVLSGGQPGKHEIQGIGPGFKPAILDLTIINKIFQIEDNEAIIMTRRLAKEEGIFAGISSGAIAVAAIRYAKENPTEQKIVAILPDTGERYLSTRLWSE